MEEKKYTSVRKLTDNRFLNLYEMDALTNSGAPFHYYFASRNTQEELPLLTGKPKANGIVIYPVWLKQPDKLVMIRQYRYPLDAWLYELPAGLIDQGETAGQAAAREMKEETGLDFLPYEEGDIAFRRPFYLGAGLTDETSTSVFGFASGEISGRLREDTESIEVLLVDKKEALRILKEERVSLRAAFLLMIFLQAEKEKPFAFLEPVKMDN
ncbi:NUDIX hydrolase [Parablautia muri]|uniref:NUDIX hydrolase n=1 Tax=Parablautia muri TaxID=2320879 RepID=A0A9X5BD69_9FIRM|nr:NUDIX hydrolase [Parablautia muri]NBJ91834.1 NUDIX hydrolase [Parablautia muri]